MTPQTAPVNTPHPARGAATGSAPRTQPAPNRRSGPRAGSTWRVPAALVALSLIPLVAGSLRLVEVAGGPELMPVNPRIDAVPAPVVIHIVAATVYALLGAFQFSARLRRRHPGAGTQTLTQGVGEGLFGTGDLSTALSLGSAWVINAAAEWVIRRPDAGRVGRVRTRTAVAGP